MQENKKSFLNLYSITYLIFFVLNVFIGLAIYSIATRPLEPHMGSALALFWMLPAILFVVFVVSRNFLKKYSKLDLNNPRIKKLNKRAFLLVILLMIFEILLFLSDPLWIGRNIPVKTY